MTTLLMLIVFGTLVYELRSHGQSWTWALITAALVVLVGYPLLVGVLEAIVRDLTTPPVPYIIVVGAAIGVAFLLWRRHRSQNRNPF